MNTKNEDYRVVFTKPEDRDDFEKGYIDSDGNSRGNIKTYTEDGEPVAYVNRADIIDDRRFGQDVAVMGGKIDTDY